MAVEALRGSGSSVSMTVLRERMVEPENAITVTALRPEDDYSPRERRGGLRFPERPEGAAPTERYSTCLVRNEKGLGFSIAGGKGSTPYRAGDTVSSDPMARKVLDPESWHCWSSAGSSSPLGCTAAQHGHMIRELLGQGKREVQEEVGLGLTVPASDI